MYEHDCTRSAIRRASLLIALAALLASTPAVTQPPAIDCSTQLLGSSMFGELFAVDTATGAGSPIGFMPGPLATEVEFDVATDTLWAEEVNGFQNLHVIDSASGASLGIVPHLAGALTGLEFVGATLYGTFIPFPGSPSELVVVDTMTGVFTTLGATGFGPVSGLAYDAANDVMYGVTAGGVPADLVTVDLATGAATWVGPTGYRFIGSIELGPDGNLYGGTTGLGMPDADFLVRIDTATGAATPVGDSGFSITGLTACALPPAPVAAIPTISGLGSALMALTLLAASVLLLRRRVAG